MIGGPIVKNKLFFFSDWERTTRRRAVTALRTVPTAAMRTGDFSATGATIYDPATGNANGTGRVPFPNNFIPANRVDPASAYMQNLIPAPNQPVFPNNYLAVGRYTADRDNVDFKVNYNPNEKLQLFTRYSFSPTEFFDPPSLGEAGGDATGGGQPGLAPGLIQTAGIGGTYAFSPSTLLDANVGYTRLRLGAENIDLDKNYGLDVLKIPGTNGPDRLQAGYPRFTFNTFSSIGNPNVSNPFSFRDPQYVASANLGGNQGSAFDSFRLRVQQVHINHFQPQASQRPAGRLQFQRRPDVAQRWRRRRTGFNTWARFPARPAADHGQGRAVSQPRHGSHAFLWFLRPRHVAGQPQTDSELRHALRNLPGARRDHWAGERYDPNTDMVYRGGYDTGKGQIAPRLGIAYRMNEKTVIRAGGGISIDPNSFRYLRDAYPATISTQYSGASSSSRRARSAPAFRRSSARI